MRRKRRDYEILRKDIIEMYTTGTKIKDIQERIKMKHGTTITTNEIYMAIPQNIPLRHERRYIIAEDVREWRSQGMTYKEILEKVPEEYGFRVSYRVIAELIFGRGPHEKATR